MSGSTSPKRSTTPKATAGKTSASDSAIGSSATSSTPPSTAAPSGLAPVGVALKGLWENLIATTALHGWTPTPESELSDSPPKCTRCNDVGIVAVRTAGAATAYVDCSCGQLRTRRLARLLGRAFGDDVERYREHTIAGWVAAVAQRAPQKAGLAAAIGTLVERWALDPRPGARSSLALIGPIGTGKSALAAILLRLRIERELADALYMTTPDLLAAIKATYGPRGEGSEPETIDAIKTTTLLVLDDLGAERPSEWVEEQLYRVVNYRYTALLPTIVTSNYPFAALKRRIGERITDRLNDMCDVVYLDTPNLRGKQPQEDAIAWP